jgi:hypothetical protein
MTIIVVRNQEAAGRTRQGIAPAQPCATRDSAQINSKRGRATVSRNSAAYQPLRMRAGGSDDRALNRGGIVANVKFLPASFQSAHASRAVTAGVLSVISAPLRLFQFFPIVKAIGSLIPSLRVQPAKQSRGGFSKCLRSFSCAVFHDRNTTTGLRAWRAEKPSLSSRNWGMRS